MSWHWKELLPVDRYTVRTVDFLHELDQKVLTLLYQPLIGAAAHSLYLTLWSHLEKDTYWSGENAHRQLMIMMDEPLNKINEGRKKLEAIGLLKTYKNKEKEPTSYLYELQPPMAPPQFFNNDVLSVYLFNRLGKNKYRQVRERFLVDKINKEEYEPVTHGFDEVFTSLHHSEMISSQQSELAESLDAQNHKEVITRGDKQQVSIGLETFDFDLLVTDLSSFVTPASMLTPEVKQAIVRLAFVYRIEALEMSRIIQQSVLHDDQVDILELRKKVQDWYRVEHGGEPPSLMLRTQPLEHQVLVNQEPVTEEEKMIKLYETTSPLELLENRSQGAKVPPPDAKIIESLLMDYQLLPGVANVLIDYMMRTNDMKLSKSLVDKVAGHWARKHLKTAKEAMEFAKREYKRNLEWREQKKEQPKAGKNTYQPYVRQDKLPKWLTEKEDVKTAGEKKLENRKFEEEKQRFELMMKQLKTEKLKRGE